MVQGFLAYVKKEKLIDPGDTIVVGVSGGADSVCLLKLLLAAQEIYSLRIHVVHVHHGIRGAEADEDAAFVEQLAGSWNLPFCLVKKDVPAYAREKKWTEEEAGRNIRYEAFHSYAKKIGADKIALAHHQNDQAETVLFQLLRGSGARGLAGIPIRRDNIIRPLMFATRDEIEKYLKEEEISYCEDTTNQLPKYSRNVIRNQILPLAEERINERAAKHIAQTAAVLQKWRAYMEKEGRRAYEKIVSESDGMCALRTESFMEQEDAIQDEILFCVIKTVAEGAKDFEQVHYEMIKSLCHADSGKKIDLPGGIECENSYKTLYFRKKSDKEGKMVCLACKPGDSHMIERNKISWRIHFALKNRDELPEKIPQKDYTKWFDYDMIINGLKLRNPKESDYFIMDKEGRRKKLSRYFIDEKIPKNQRNEQFVLADGAHVLWVLSGRISEAYKVGETTKRVLIVTICEQ